ALASKRHGRLGLAAAVWAAGFLLPVAGLVPLAGVLLAERYLYLPSVAASLVVGYVCVDLPLAARAKLALRLAGVALALVALVATLARLPVWADDSALYQSMVRDSPGSALGRFNLANLYLEEGRLPDALRLYSEAVRLDPEYVRALTNRAGVLSLLGRHREAVADAERAIALDPGHANAHHQLGKALGGLSHWHRAAAALGRAVELRPDDVGARLNLAIALANTGRTREAERTLREILREHPDEPHARAMLARLRAAAETG
ncbi:MAG TPA: tetratricopeptide repeat protein, partial [Thermoanaerobaculia bacterium]|nr:tetratricopeptide repeat protein [Thermoanaerobaculia bacterium]